MLLWAGLKCLVDTLNRLYVHTPVLTCFLNHVCLVAVFLELTVVLLFVPPRCFALVLAFFCPAWL